VNLPPLKIAPRPYQSSAVEDVLAEFRRGVRSTLLVMPTGTGKTVVFAILAAIARAKGRVLVIAHREELVEQARERIAAVTDLNVGVEAGAARVDADALPDVVVASVQTLARAERRERFAPDAFVLVVVDEAHHATAKTYGAVLDRFAKAKVLGVTATPDRLDGRGLRAVFQTCAHVYEIRDAIEDQWLVPIKQRRVTVEGLSLDTVRTRGRNGAGDFDDDALAKQMLAEGMLHRIAAPLADLASARPTIVFTPTVAVAGELAAVLGRYVGASEVRSLDGSVHRDERAATVNAYKRGDFRVLVNCALFTEGFDAPRVSCVAVARPTKSRALYAQMIGRGTRLHPETEKDHLLVVDFTDASTHHKLVTVADVLGGLCDEDVRERVNALAVDNPDTNVSELLTAAEAQVAAERRHRLLCEARYRAQTIDPFDVIGADPHPGRGGCAMTPTQVQILRDRGVPAKGYDRDQANALIDKMFERDRLGLCRFKPASILAKYGLNPDVSRALASEAMEAMRANNWRPTAALLRDPRFAPQVST